MGGAGFGDQYVSRRFVGENKAPSFSPRDQRRQENWLHAIRRHLEYTLNVDPVSGPVCVVYSDRSLLLNTHPSIIVDEHTNPYSALAEPINGSKLDEQLMSCNTAAESGQSCKIG